MDIFGHIFIFIWPDWICPSDLYKGIWQEPKTKNLLLSSDLSYASIVKAILVSKGKFDIRQLLLKRNLSFKFIWFWNKYGAEWNDNIE